MPYGKNGRYYDDGRSSKVVYQDDKFRDHSIKSIQTSVRAIEPDKAYTALNPKWGDICSAKTACHHQEV